MGRATALPTSTLIRMSEAPPYSTHRVETLRLPAGRRESELVAVEEPLEIRIGGEPVAVTMRTPGHDEELALGFCVTEGLEPISARAPDDLAANTVEVEARRLRSRAASPPLLHVVLVRGVREGRDRGDRGERAADREHARGSHRRVAALPGRLLDAQRAFAATGGLHATGLFDATGDLVCVREDVGRHNAMDKVVGWAFLERSAPARRARPVRQRAGSPSSSCRKLPSRDVPCSSRSAPRRRSRSSSPRIAE